MIPFVRPVEADMQLRRGITGFRHVDDPRLPVSDFAAFRRYCTAAVRMLGGRVVSIDARRRETQSSFGLAVLQLRNQTIAVLLNDHYPVIAHAGPPADGDLQLRFVDAPDLATVFRACSVCEVLESCDLTVPLTPEACRHLARPELKQVDCWKPRRVGDLIFNFGD
ncbi:MAG: hypothetical protein NTY19_30515 [Planctomycetota bacterium]|nr:hypothetical protein [Planctomycetota bacterium]